MVSSRFSRRKKHGFLQIFPKKKHGFLQVLPKKKPGFLQVSRKKKTWFPPGFPEEKNMVSSRFSRRIKHGFLQIFPKKITWFPPDFPEEKTWFPPGFPEEKKHGFLQVFPKKKTWFPPDFPEEKTWFPPGFPEEKIWFPPDFPEEKNMVSSRFSRQILCVFLTFSLVAPCGAKCLGRLQQYWHQPTLQDQDFGGQNVRRACLRQWWQQIHGKMLLHIRYIYLQNWVIFRVNVGNYSTHGAYGNVGKCGKILYKWRWHGKNT